MWIREYLSIYKYIQWVQTCCLKTRPFILHLFSAVCSNGSMSDFTRHIISGNYEAVISTSLSPSGPCVGGRGAGFTPISPDSRRREAVARRATVITPVPSNCYIHAPRGDSMWKGNSRYKPCRTEERYRGCWV